MASNVAPNMLEHVVNERMAMQRIAPELLDFLLAEGWRLLGDKFLRHSFTTYSGKLCATRPLRIRLEGWQPTAHQRKLLRRNADLNTVLAPIQINARTHDLFHLHSQRHDERRPQMLSQFLSEHPEQEPVEGFEMRVFEGPVHIGSSFFHLGEKSISATYCIFDPASSKRSIGTYTLLQELMYAAENGYAYYYHGYINDVPSRFDYKLNFNNVEYYDWAAHAWFPYAK